MSTGETARATPSSVSLGEETNGLQGRAPGCAGPRVQKRGRVNAESDTSLTLRCSQFGGGDRHQRKSSKAAERANGRGSGKDLPVLKRCHLGDILQGKDLRCQGWQDAPRSSQSAVAGAAATPPGAAWTQGRPLGGKPRLATDCGPVGSSSLSGECR